MLLNVPLRLVPTNVIAVMITTAINAAIRPYSIAVLDAAVEALSRIGSLAPIVVNLRPADNSVPHIAQLEQRDPHPTSTTRSSRKWVWSNDRMCLHEEHSPVV